MTCIHEISEADLRERMAVVEARFPDIATFDEGQCECCAQDRFADVHGWQNAHLWEQWSTARWLLGEAP